MERIDEFIKKNKDELCEIHACRFLDWCIYNQVDYTLPDFSSETIYKRFKEEDNDRKDS